MILALTDKQIEKLSDYSLALAKGQSLAALAVPILTGGDVFVLLKFFVSGMIYLYFSLWLIERKGR